MAAEHLRGPQLDFQAGTIQSMSLLDIWALVYCNASYLLLRAALLFFICVLPSASDVLKSKGISISTFSMFMTVSSFGKLWANSNKREYDDLQEEYSSSTSNNSSDSSQKCIISSMLEIHNKVPQENY